MTILRGAVARFATTIAVLVGEFFHEADAIARSRHNHSRSF